MEINVAVNLVRDFSSIIGIYLEDRYNKVIRRFRFIELRRRGLSLLELLTTRQFP